MEESSRLFFKMSHEEPAEDEFFVYEQTDLFASAFPLMDELRRKGKMCDVVLKVGEASIPAHRIVLSSTIPYFYAMFSNDMLECKLNEINIQAIEPAALENLINYAYTGRIKINSMNVQLLMAGSSYLQLTQVRDVCADFLRRRFHPHIVLGIRQFADTLGCSALVESCDRYVDCNFPEVSKSEEYLNLTADEIEKIIKRDELHISSEELVFEAVIRWIHHHPQTREASLPRLLSSVRLPLLTPHYLADVVATEDLIRTSLQCRDLLDEARDYHLMPERQMLIQGNKGKPRTLDHVAGIIYAVGGLTKSGESLSSVEAYSPALDCWAPASPMSTLRSRVGVAALRGRLFALGGYNGVERLATVEAYDPLKQEWARVAAMSCKRSAVGACALANHIYVCGGYDGCTSLNTVERYSPMVDTWEVVAPMNRFRSAGGIAALGGCVWAMGGHDGLAIFDSMERFDPREPHWSKQKPMINRRCRLGVATLNGKLYVCGGYDGSRFLQSVEEFDPVNNQWRYLKPLNLMRSRVALVANMGKLWAIGGYNGESNLSTVEVYDPQLDTWSFVAPMCAHEGGVGVGVLPMGSY